MKKSSKKKGLSDKEVEKVVKDETKSFGNMLILKKLPGYFLIFCIILVFLFLLYVIKPFITVIFLAAVLTIAFYPIYRKLHKWLRGWSRLASFITCLAVILVIVIPLSFFVLLLAVEATDAYTVIQQKIESGVFDKYLQWGDGGFFYDIKTRIDTIVDLNGIDLKKDIIGWSKGLSGFLADQAKNFAVGVSSFLLGLVVMLFSMYYFFKDGKDIVKRVGSLSPLPSIYEEELFKKIGSMVKAVVFGVFLTSIIQGIVGGIGFTIAGVSNPVFWGTAIAFFSLVPVVGTAIVWVPASIVLAVLGNYGAAIFIFIWGILAVGSVDNFVRPYLIGGKAHTYPLLTFLVVLGGVLTMNLKGVIIGPLILMIFLSFLHIYESEYKKVLKK